MACDRLAMRVYDEDGKFVWEDQDNLRESVRSNIMDIDADGQSDIIVQVRDHSTVFLLGYIQRPLRPPPTEQQETP